MAVYCKAFGLNISSEIDLLLPPIKALSAPDITIQVNEILEDTENCTWDGVLYKYKGKEQIILKWESIGSYHIKFGNEIIIHPNRPINYDNVRQPLLGTILAVALQQRGCFVLHGSAVIIKGKAVIFIGNKGQGKSTLAAWMISKGHQFLSDDICAIDFEKDQVMSVRPAFSKIKLYPEVLKHLGDNSDRYLQVHPEVPKRIADKSASFCSSSMPVGAICILETGDDFELEQIHGMEAVKVILANMLINRFPENQQADLTQEIFLQSTNCAKTVPLYRLGRPRDLNKLSEATRIIEELATW